MIRHHLLAACLATIPGVALAQLPAAPLVVSPVALPPGQLLLQRGTEVKLRTVASLNSRYSRVGERFDLKVAEPVSVGGHMIIPPGARAVGEVTRVVGKGAFGKSGKMDLKLHYVVIGDRHVRLEGQAFDAGKGGTAGTVATAIAAGVFSAFVTGTSADFPPGTQLSGFIAEDVPLVIQAAAPTSPPPVVLRVAEPAAAAAEQP